MQVKIRFRDLSVKDQLKRNQILRIIDSFLERGQFLMGDEVETFEAQVAQYCGQKYSVGVGSGTDALYLCLRALNLQPGDEVITTPLSWIATLNSIHLAGAKAIFVDINNDLNINTNLIEEKINSKTRAILPVHFTGRLCDMDTILKLAKKYNLMVIEDAAQAFGAHRGNRYAGSFGDMAAFSMNPMKVLSGFGEAGAITLRDPELASYLKALRYLGTVDKEICISPSLNFKIDTIQAALLTYNFEFIEQIISRRIEIARIYTEHLSNVVLCPGENTIDNRESVFFDYTILADSRDELKIFLEKNGIETKIKHPLLMPNQPAYRQCLSQPLPVANYIINKILCLPIHEKISADEVMYIIQKVKKFYNHV